ncbi:Mechanosensitive ion channel [Sulfidibacter corallicola]|uniref:Mechanosensitive ion channel n=1 Tax=Sulfidibacter corallicola TaxID=2818388 RepID=A0A8A4TX36_SULCO|nr:mechanosensitive ion channel domain-containing protein [Sulfidibacter corallicola]QTD53907.1 mechanosensitive ion channel [Sulfidibacter corallicola]
MNEIVKNWILENMLPANSMSQELAPLLSLLFLGLVVFALGFIANLIAKRYILTWLSYFITRTKNKWDDVFLDRKVFNRLSHMAPAVVIYLAAGVIFPEAEEHLVELLMKKGALIYMILAGLLVVNSFFSAVSEIYANFEVSKNRPIKGYIQAIKIIVYLFAIILVISTLIDRSPLILLSGLGALTAVLLLVFKDTILGFVAGIQLASNNMVRQGDWISMPKHGADGDVIEVTLTTIKVQNWDKTITYVPIYSMISDSFANWRGMAESGGRRIVRSIKIDMTSIAFVDNADLAEFRKIHLLKDYLDEKDREIQEFNRKTGVDTSNLVNGRRQTNVGIFRAYALAYLRQHAMIHQEMTLLVRQLQPEPNGLPIQLYCFSKDQRWAFYEDIQSDIMDHLLAIVPLFGLRVFQQPTGQDVRMLGLTSAADAK